MNVNKKLLYQALSSEDLFSMLDGKPNIVTMKDISKMTSLEQIFKKTDHAIIFTAVNSPQDGHWNVIHRTKAYGSVRETVQFFDSYGMYPCKLIQMLQKKGHETYGQNYNLLQLLGQSPYSPDRISYNEIKYQKDGLSQTCGRYCILVLVLKSIYEKRGLPFDGNVFYKCMSGLKKKFKKSYDELVCFFTDIEQLQQNV